MGRGVNTGALSPVGGIGEFQGRPEQERLAFCSWCCCHGGCNLCMDISKYNIKGLKIYGG